jgi:GT2 family glycosyltransferase
MNPTGTPTRPIQIVIVAYNQPDGLHRCLAAASGSAPITVVDNSSNPAVRAVVELSGAEYVDPGNNLGFGSGVNVVLRRIVDGPPTDLLLLNPDAMFQANDVTALAARLHRPGHRRVGALSPALRGDDHRPQRVMWPFPTPGRAWLEAFGLGKLNRSADFAVGAVLLLRWEAIRDVGLFDERFFLYAEETDWQRRAHLAGWRSAVSADLVADHSGGASSTDELSRMAFFHSGGEIYQRKWHGVLGWQLYRAAVLIGCLPRIAHPDRARRAGAVLRFSLYLRGPRRTAGLEGKV